MPLATDKSYIGKGKVYIDGRWVGNCSALSLGHENEEIEQQDYTEPGGGLWNSVNRVLSVPLTMTLVDFSPENLAQAVFGTYSAFASQSVSDESITTGTELDLLIRTAEPIDTAQPVSVTSDPAGTTYTVGTDYILSSGGITALSTGSIPVSTPLLVSYESLAGDVIEALVQSAQEVALFFEGLNEAQNGRPMHIDIYRAKFAAVEELGLIADEFGAIELTGNALKDTTIVDPGKSKYYNIVPTS